MSGKGLCLSTEHRKRRSTHRQMRETTLRQTAHVHVASVTQNIQSSDYSKMKKRNCVS